MGNNREEVKYNKIVNFDEETKEITVLDGTFKYFQETEYKTGVEMVITMKGATGSKFEAVSKEQFDETIEPYLDDKEELLCYMADNFGELNSEMIRSADASEEALKELFFDLSYAELWDYLREELNLSEDEAYIFNCIGGGRCFDKDFQGNINPELSQVIRDIES